MRASSAAEKGLASGSERAAASISAGVMRRMGRRSGFALVVLREVVILLISGRAPRRMASMLQSATSRYANPMGKT
jgi:hypothetical protein